MSIKRPYYIVKITDKEWADKLVAGEIYMRPISEFSDILERPEKSRNDFRGDILEGMTHSFASGKEHHFFNEAFGGNLSNLSGAGFISESLRQEKIYSMYCLEYSELESEFVPPNKNLLDFGDTAVIILNPREFLFRICNKLFVEYNESFWVGAQRVCYDVNLTKQQEYNEFSKSESYSWQNEYRIAIDLSEGKIDIVTWENMTDFARIMFLNHGGKVDTEIERKSLTLDIGSINDICVQVTTQDLVQLKLPIDKLLFQPLALPPLDPPRKPRVSAYRPVIKPKE